MKKVLWIIFVVILFFGIVFGYNIFFKNKEYKQLEKDMEDVVANYLGQYINEFPKNGEKKINITDVIEKGYGIDMLVNSDVCDGYVVIKKVSIAYEYDGYIKCDNYKTKGYN